MTIALIGYGKMGHMTESLALARGIHIGPKLDEFDTAITPERFRNVDVAIDFSTPDAVIGNIESLSALGVNLVIGTTGWQDKAAHVRALVEENNIGLVWSPNYSIGVNAFFRIVAEAAKLLSNEPAYEAWAWEIHHSAKKDAPSGTLLKLVDDMKAAGYARNIDVSSNRAGKIAGTHEIGFDSAADTITLRHTARSREGFALGALKAAEWIAGKKGFHEFADILFQQ
ncbi:MAG TPA: 4-hydroxy-tetrahydrodipicolinate reductase [Bryobacteraceae bacterium]|nr:4-hydroxy-tetrahydrodipicolinate reductase [Bryobacteraceae bacterium]